MTRRTLRRTTSLAVPALAAGTALACLAGSPAYAAGHGAATLTRAQVPGLAPVQKALTISIPRPDPHAKPCDRSLVPGGTKVTLAEFEKNAAKDGTGTERRLSETVLALPNVTAATAYMTAARHRVQTCRSTSVNLSTLGDSSVSGTSSARASLHAAAVPAGAQDAFATITSVNVRTTSKDGTLVGHGPVTTTTIRTGRYVVVLAPLTATFSFDVTTHRATFVYTYGSAEKALLAHVAPLAVRDLAAA